MEGRFCLNRSLTAAPHVDQELRSQAMRSAGWLARLSGDSAQAADLQQSALVLSHQHGDREGAAAAMQELALSMMHQGNADAAVSQMRQAVSLLTAIEERGESPSEATAVALANLGQVLIASGQPAEAMDVVDHALERQLEAGNAWAASDTMRIRGDALCALGRYDEAMQAYRSSLTSVIEHQGDRRFLANALSGIAGVHIQQGKLAAGVTLYGAVDAMHLNMGAGIEAWQQVKHANLLGEARIALTSRKYAAAWGRGQSLSLEQIASMALNDDSAVTAGGLTTRELEVLRLIAEGKSDKVIADTLYISTRTVGGHVTNLLGKLAAESRTAAVTQAYRTGLLDLPENE
jgi:non-specific serine/threonine protein kinase